jgi:hypothetical protein
LSNFQAGYVSGVEAVAVAVDSLRSMGKTPDEIAADISELAQRLRADYDRDGTAAKGIPPKAP